MYDNPVEEGALDDGDKQNIEDSCASDTVLPPPVPSRPDFPSYGSDISPDNGRSVDSFPFDIEKENNEDACSTNFGLPPPLPSRTDISSNNPDYVFPDVDLRRSELVCDPIEDENVLPVNDDGGDSCPLEITGQTTFHDMCMENPAFQSDV